ADNATDGCAAERAQRAASGQHGATHGTCTSPDCRISPLTGHARAGREACEQNHGHGARCNSLSCFHKSLLCQGNCESITATLPLTFQRFHRVRGRRVVCETLTANPVPGVPCIETVIPGLGRGTALA